MRKFTEQDEELIRLELCSRLSYGLRGRVVATCVDTNHIDMDGFYGEKDFDVDVELDKIDIGNYEIHVTALGNGNDDLCDYIEESQTMGEPWTIFDFKPYLRPMSSLTQEERDQMKKDTCPNGTGTFDDRYLLCPMNHFGEMISYTFMNSILTWLRKHHFDCMGLIEMGLARPAKEGMYE